ALLWRAFITGRDYALRVSAAFALILLYFYATLVQTVLDSSNHVAGRGFMFSALYMLAAIAIAAAGWSRDVHRRMAIALVGAAAVAIGALVVILLHEGARGFGGLRLGSTATALLVMVGIGLSAYEIAGGSNDTISHSYASLLHPTRKADPSVSQRLYKWDA